YWQVVANFALDEATARKLGPAWNAFLEQRDEKGAGPTLKAQNAWLGEAGAIRAELVEVGGEKFDIRQGGAPVIAPVDLDAPEETTPDARRTPSARFAAPEKCDLTGQVRSVAELAGLTN